MAPGGGMESVELPATLLAELRNVADQEQRPLVDVLNELVERGLGERKCQAQVRTELRRGRDAGLPDADETMTDAHRDVLRDKIAEGVRSLRDGHVIDGEAFMARIDADMAELERHGHS